MPDTVSSLPVAPSRLHNGAMADWQRLGEHVIARRLALGYKTRIPLAAASGISTRILGDIETGRRNGRFDPKTIAALERTLGWAVGSVDTIVNGGEPSIVQAHGIATLAGRPTVAGGGVKSSADAAPGRDDALTRVMLSDIPDAQKRQIVELLIAERAAFDQRIAERAEQMIRLVQGEQPAG